MLGQCHWEQGGTQVLSVGNFVFNTLGQYEKCSAPPFSLIARIEFRPKLIGWSAALKIYPIISDNRQTNFRPQPIASSTLSSVHALLANHAPDGRASFNANFKMGEDDRGPHIFLTQPISPRFCQHLGRGMESNAGGNR
jgi:UDP-N-acetylmuramoyl-tripeptide--D-alanyl-D-alanine ligase